MNDHQLRVACVKLAYENPEMREHLLPLLRTAGSFENSVKGKTFKNPETGNDVQFGSLPEGEQKKLRDQWSKNTPGASAKPAKATRSDTILNGPELGALGSAVAGLFGLHGSIVFRAVETGKHIPEDSAKEMHKTLSDLLSDPATQKQFGGVSPSDKKKFQKGKELLEKVLAYKPKK